MLEIGTVLEAVAFIGHPNVNTVITDVDMPGAVSGLDLAELIRASTRPRPVIFTSDGCRWSTAHCRMAQRSFPNSISSPA
jgi:DNA-binding NarL/FixJ family response regulator